MPRFKPFQPPVHVPHGRFDDCQPLVHIVQPALHPVHPIVQSVHAPRQVTAQVMHHLPAQPGKCQHHSWGGPLQPRVRHPATMPAPARARPARARQRHCGRRWSADCRPGPPTTRTPRPLRQVPGAHRSSFGVCRSAGSRHRFPSSNPELRLFTSPSNASSAGATAAAPPLTVNQRRSVRCRFHGIATNRDRCEGGPADIGRG